MRYVLALLSVVSVWGIMPASSEECEPEISLACAVQSGSTATLVPRLSRRND